MAGYSFDRETANKLYAMAHGPSTTSGPVGVVTGNPGAQSLGSVVASVSAGTTVAPASGSFYPIDFNSSGVGKISTVAVPFKNPYNATYAAGDVVVMVDCGLYHVPVSSNAAPTAQTGYGTLSSALAGTDATASVALDAASPLEPSTSITAQNWVGMDGASGAKCIVSKSGSEYILIQLACPAP